MDKGNAQLIATVKHTGAQGQGHVLATMDSKKYSTNLGHYTFYRVLR